MPMCINFNYIILFIILQQLSINNLTDGYLYGYNLVFI